MNHVYWASLMSLNKNPMFLHATQLTSWKILSCKHQFRTVWMGIHADHLLSDNNNNCANNSSCQGIACELSDLSEKTSIMMLIELLLMHALGIWSINAFICIQTTSGKSWVLHPWTTSLFTLSFDYWMFILCQGPSHGGLICNALAPNYE